MSSQPTVKPLGDNFQGHTVWPCENQWFGKFWYKAKICAPKGERVKKFFPDVIDMIKTEMQHATRTKTTGRSLSVYFTCQDDLKLFLTVYDKLVNLVVGPLDHDHIDGIRKNYFFMPRSEPWYQRHDTRLEGCMYGVRGLDLTGRKELRKYVHATIQENLGDNFTVRGASTMLPTYYVNWSDVEPVLALLKLAGVDFIVTRAIINDKYDETTPWRYPQWQ